MKRKLTMLLASLFLGIGLLSAQQRVTGTVTSADDGQPIIGASVVVDGTSIGVITGVDGSFVLPNVPSSATIIRISFVGYDPAEVAVAPEVNVALRSSSQQITTVVVTGLTTVDRRLFTGAADRLSAEDVKIDGMSEISRALEGRSAGVSVQNVSGTFGAAPKIRIRGATSIYGDSKPLWVVDGVIIEDVVEVSADELSSGDATTLISSAIAGLNPDDIESFQILKDGSATSIYGARAMAGVIVVTTKRGRAGVSRISYSGEFTMRMVPNYGNYNIMNSQDQMSVYQEMASKGWLNYANVANASESGVYGKMTELLSTINPATGQFYLANTPEAKNRYLMEAEMRNTNWFKHLFNANLMHSHSVSITSGTEKSQYYASMSALVDPGWTKQSKVNRYTANVNASYEVIDNLNLDLRTSMAYRKQTAPGTLSQETDPVRGEVKRNFDINPFSYALNTSRTLDANTFYTRNYAPFNILDELENNYMDINVANMNFQAELSYKPHRTVTVAVLGALKYQTSTQEHHILDNSNQAGAYRAMRTSTIRNANPYLYSDPDNPYEYPISVLPEGGIYKRDDWRSLGYDFRASATYNNVFNNEHIVALYGGIELNALDRRYTWFRGWGLQYSMGEIPFYAYEVFKRGAEENSNYFEYVNSRTRNAAFIFNGAYSFRGKYAFNGTVRYEGSNALGNTRSARWLPTWNVSGSWDIGEENFFQRVKPAVSHLKFKASYSLTADRGPSWVTNSRVVIGSQTPWRPSAGLQESALYISQLENGALTYEKKHELNLGLEVGFLDDRLSLMVDWYRRNNFDLIGQTVTQGIGGQITKWGNVADMRSSGTEVTFSSVNIRSGDFSWNTDFIYSYNTNKITKLHATGKMLDYLTGSIYSGMEGYARGSIFSLQFMGLNDEGLPTFLNQDGEHTVTDINFQERDNDKLKKNLVYEGSSDPKHVGSFGNIFSYKGFRLNVYITYSFGSVIRMDPVFSYSYSDLSAMPNEFKNRWVVPGDEKYTSVPVIASYRQYAKDTNLSYAYNGYNYSTERIAKGDYIRMKEISLSYDFPRSLIENWKLSSLSLKIQATNPFLIYADKKLNGQDPEFLNAGGVAIPVPKQFTLTLRVGL